MLYNTVYETKLLLTEYPSESPTSRKTFDYQPSQVNLMDCNELNWLSWPNQIHTSATRDYLHPRQSRNSCLCEHAGLRCGLFSLTVSCQQNPIADVTVLAKDRKIVNMHLLGNVSYKGIAQCKVQQRNVLASRNSICTKMVSILPKPSLAAECNTFLGVLSTTFIFSSKLIPFMKMFLSKISSSEIHYHHLCER